MNLVISTTVRHHFSWGALLYALESKKVAPTCTSADIVQQCISQRITKNQILKITQPLGVTIKCLEGSVWVTQDGDLRDVVLDAGQAFVVDRNQRTLLQGLTDARVRLIEPIRTH